MAMGNDHHRKPAGTRRSGISRREVVRAGSAVGATAVAGVTAAAFGQAGDPRDRATAQPADNRVRSPKHYDMKKSINMWAFPYPERMSLRECFALARRAGFDAVELNFDLKDDVSPDTSGSKLRDIGRMARDEGLDISGLCSFLFWPYCPTSNDPAIRARGLELATRMVPAARRLGTENLLVVPGAVHIPWYPRHEPVAYTEAMKRADHFVRRLIPLAEREDVYLNIENIFMNGFLLSPDDMNRFVDSFESERVRVHFDTGNIMQFQFPEHWIPVLGKRIKNIHFKEFTKKGTDVSIESFRPLLDGTTNWPAVLEALEAVGYRGYLTFEYFHPFPHYPEALIYQASDALNRMLGRAV